MGMRVGCCLRYLTVQLVLLGSMWLMLRRTPWLFLSIALIVALGCQSDAQRIREANEDARARQTEAASAGALTVIAPAPTVEAGAKPLTANINVADVRNGDCIISRLPAGVEVEKVQIVLCSEEWQYRVLSSFEVEAGGSFPGDDYFVLKAFNECDRRYTYQTIPTSESWDQGDRTVNCLQDKFGLGLEELDRLTSAQRLNPGDCINEAPATDFMLVELVSCAGDWELRVLGSFDLEDGPFQGDAYIDAQAAERCDRRFGFIYPPSAESWLAGDRTVICVQDSYGTGNAGLERLDRLVGADTLRDGECYNEAPDTNFSHVELVDCSGEWEFQVINSFVVPATGSYPADDYFDQQASEKCDGAYSFFNYPTEESWLQGDRTVICSRPG